MKDRIILERTIRVFLALYPIFIFGCDSSLNYDDFIEKKGDDRVGFQMDDKQCQKEGELLANQSEGSKRAGEIIIDTKYYKMSCMKRKGWISKKGS